MLCLSIHAGYRCRHTGACCTAGWHIPAEPAVVAAVDLHFGPAARGSFLHADGTPPDPAILATDPDGRCVFFDAGQGRLCRIHRELGEPALPSACRQFPRVTLADPRGTWITLSHFCPTAAALLFTSTPLLIVDAPASLSLSEAAEGLDATAALPPLLRPGMLMDFEGYGTWERASVDLIAHAGPDVNAALAALQAATRTIREWSPGGEPLAECVSRVIGGATFPAVAEDPDAEARRHALALASVPDGLSVPGPARPEQLDGPAGSSLWRDFDAVIRRYLAARLFASWWPYLGLELTAVVEAILVHAAVLRRCIARRLALDRGEAPGQIVLEAIRDADLLMVHFSDGPALARLIARDS